MLFLWSVERLICRANSSRMSSSFDRAALREFDSLLDPAQTPGTGPSVLNVLLRYPREVSLNDRLV
jgi:hypothetical protein